MSLPMTAVGPLNVLTNPIFTDCWATAGAVESATSAAVPMRKLFISAVLRGSGKVSGAILVDRLMGQKPFRPWPFASRHALAHARTISGTRALQLASGIAFWPILLRSTRPLLVKK